MKARFWSSRNWSLLLAVASLSFVVLMALGRESLSTVWGDESTYLAMAESLVQDGDLRFTEADARRLAGAPAQGGNPLARSTVILQRTAAGVAYSKPVVYALLSAPAVWLAGDHGPLLLNTALLLLAAWLGWLFLRRLGGADSAAPTLVTFIGASVLVAQVGWRMSDLLQAVLSLAGLVLTLACLRRREEEAPNWLDGHFAAWCGGGLLGLLVPIRLPNLLIALAALAALIVAGRPRRAARVALAGVASFALVALLSQALIGTSSPYRAVRSSFDAASGYPTQPTGPAAERFETHPTTQRMGMVPELRPRLSAYSALYYGVGRHTGLLWYFPAALALLATALRRPDPVTTVLLLGAAGSVFFYVVWNPENYFGGSTFIGNRYFMAIYPLLLVALRRLPGRLALASSWVVAGVVGLSALLSLGSAQPASASQSHTRAGLFPRLPYESSARAIDGRRDRYWEGDLVRFVDFEPAASQEAFVLDSRAAPAEALIVTKEAEKTVLLRYRAKVEGLELRVTQRGETQRYPLAGKSGHVRLELDRAWRRHPFPWDKEALYTARSVRFALTGGDETSPDEARRVRFWYAGDPTHLDQIFKVLPGKIEVPQRAVAGSTTELAVQARNMSPVAWLDNGVFPVSLGYQMLPERASAGTAEPVSPIEGPLIEGPRIGLGEIVRSGDPIELALPIHWPETPGRYRLRVDLLVEDYSWFAVRVGQPLAEATVLVEAPQG